jgi:sarcosine oxidase subunit beta
MTQQAEGLPAEAEVVIIGAGVVGCSTAYRLALAGIRTVVLDRQGPAEGAAASATSAGGVRQQGRDPRELPLAMAAIRLWATLERELEADVHYRRGGNLRLIEAEADLPAIEQQVAAERAGGLDVELVSGERLRSLAPALAPQVIAAVSCPSDGQADPVLTTRAFAAAARRAGATLVANCPARGLLRRGGAVSGVETASGTISAGCVLLAAGVWSAELAATIGLDLPLQPLALQMLLSEPAPPVLEQVLGGTGSRRLSLKQRRDGAFLIGGGWPGDGDIAAATCTVRPESVAASWAEAVAVLPAVAQSRLARSWCGLEAASFDGVPLVGAVPEASGLYLAAGFSGHGFALAPATGQQLAALLQGRPAPLFAPLAPRGITRSLSP